MGKRRSLVVALMILMLIPVIGVSGYCEPEPEPEPRYKYKTNLYYDFGYIVRQWNEYPNEHICVTPDVDARRYTLRIIIVNSESHVTMNLLFYMRRDYSLSAYFGAGRFTVGNNTVIALASNGWNATYVVVR